MLNIINILTFLTILIMRQTLFCLRYPMAAKLPQDYHDHFFSTLLYECYNYPNVERVFNEIHDQTIYREIIMYKITKNIRKDVRTYYLIYNPVIQNYEMHGTRFINYNDALKYMWNNV